MQNWTQAAIDLLRQPIADGDVAERLVSARCAPSHSEKLAAFLPPACGRAQIEKLVAARGTTMPAAVATVERRNAAFDAINEARLNGGRFADHVCAGSVFVLVGPDEEPDRPAPPWRAFWRRSVSPQTSKPHSIGRGES